MIYINCSNYLLYIINVLCYHKGGIVGGLGICTDMFGALSWGRGPVAGIRGCCKLGKVGS